jgi:hypothetical protein
VAADVALRDKRVRAVIEDRAVSLHVAADWTDGLGGSFVGAMVELSVDRPASMDAVVPGWVCRHGRLHGVPVRITAAGVTSVRVGVDTQTHRVLLIEPVASASDAKYRDMPGELPFPPMACDESD